MMGCIFVVLVIISLVAFTAAIYGVMYWITTVEDEELE